MWLLDPPIKGPPLDPSDFVYTVPGGAYPTQAEAMEKAMVTADEINDAGIWYLPLFIWYPEHRVGRAQALAVQV